MAGPVFNLESVSRNAQYSERFSDLIPRQG
jgi:hypothetical protein